MLYLTLKNNQITWLSIQIAVILEVMIEFKIFQVLQLLYTILNQEDCIILSLKAKKTIHFQIKVLGEENIQLKI
jgi:hypothetical protein